MCGGGGHFGPPNVVLVEICRHACDMATVLMLHGAPNAEGCISEGRIKDFGKC